MKVIEKLLRMQIMLMMQKCVISIAVILLLVQKIEEICLQYWKTILCYTPETNVILNVICN